MISWQTAQSLLLFFGPWLVPRVLTWYRSLKNPPPSRLQPLPRQTAYVLGLLFLSGLVAFLSTLPVFAPENIFHRTQSRLHTSGGVLLTRLSSMRPLTPEDEKLRTLFDSGGMDARLLYLLFGPSVTLNNPLATAGEVDAFRSFLIYAMPSILAPHLLHLFALGITTSSTLSGSRTTSSWRTLAILSALVPPTLEIYYISTYSHTPNSRSTRPTDMDFAHWKIRIYRSLSIALIDALLGWFIYLQSTGRAFPSPATPIERLADHAAQLDQVFAKTRSIGVVRNAHVRDPEMRRRVDEYWRKEGEVMKDVAEDVEVVQAQRNALARLDMNRVSGDAENFVDGILGLAPPEGNVGATNASTM